MTGSHKLILSLSLLLGLVTSAVAQKHDHKREMSKERTSASSCPSNDITCSNTVTAAFAPNGDLWRVWSVNEFMFYQVSTDLGKTFNEAVQVDIAPEAISARNENRPKIGFDAQQGVYLSWAKSGEKRFTADVRFSYSADGGKHFSDPVTINNDNIVAGHSFNEMMVSPTGEVTIVWLDGRYAHQQRQLGNKVNGSELYLAKGQPRKDIAFTNEALAGGTCVCCRIAMDTNAKGNLSVFWRHIFGDNIREFALITLDEHQPELAQVKQISHDHWYIEGCPHQGGGISIDENNRYHLTWYNQGDKGKGIFYSYSDSAGEHLSTPKAIGQANKQAA